MQNGYDQCYFDGLNRYYLNQEKLMLKEAFNTPPNYFDFFVPAKVFHLEQETTLLQSQIEDKDFKLSQNKHEITFLFNEVAYYKNAEKSALDKLDAISQSTSWRITLPLRKISEALSNQINVIKKGIYPYILRCFRLLFKNHYLKTIVITVFSKIPLLKTKVKNITDHLLCDDLDSQSKMQKSDTNFELTPRAEELYTILNKSFSSKGDHR